jgi:hypothetical protein
MPTIEQVYIEASAPPSHAGAVAEVFRQAGFDADVQAAIESRGAGDVATWIIQVALKDTVEGFFLALGGAAFKVLVLDLFRARGGDRGQIDMGGPEYTRLILPASLPEEALDALASIDWKDLEGGWLVWNTDRHEWVDHMRRDS